MLERTRIVLINTSHPGNIGSTARAMKTMGLSQLYLVQPLDFPHPKALEMASGAVDILEQAKIVQTLDDALVDCTLVLGTSARLRKIPWPLLSPRAAAEKIQQESLSKQSALLFGREKSGLTNDELQRCHFHVQIPANPLYSSLNLSAAVQVIAYELYLAGCKPPLAQDEWDYRLADSDEMEKFFEHLQMVLTDIDFLKINAPRKSMTRLRRLFLRTRLDIMELNMLRGLLTAVENLNEKK